MSTQQSIAAISLFADLAPNELAALSARALIQTFPKNAILITEGDHSDSLYLLMTGSVKVYSCDEEGKEVTLNILGPGDYFGELALIDEQPRSASVISLETCRMTVIKRLDFIDCLQRNSSIAISLMKVLAGKLRQQTDSTRNLVLMDVYQRFVKRLYELAAEQDDGLVIEGISHKQLADQVYASREMITLILKDLKEGGYIQTDRKRIVIKKRLPAKW